MRAWVVALPTALALGAGVGVAWSTRDPSSPPLDVLTASAQGASFVRGYDHLVEGLPNAKGPDGNPIHDSAVVGRISSVEEEAGYVELGEPGTEGKPGARVVAFRDPEADWRTLRLTVDVSESLGGTPTSQLVLSWTVMGSTRTGPDAEAVGRALRDLGTVVVLSRALPTGPEHLGIDRTIPEPQTGLLTVAADGTLGFPLAEDGWDAEGFADGVDTLDELRAAARRPDWSRPNPLGAP